MADILVPVGNSIVKRFHDNGDGTFSEVVYVGGGGTGGGAVTVADGADVAQGATADAAWSGTGATTVVAALKALYARFRGGQATMANSLPVVLASDQSALTVDTELPAAAALAEAMANPTAPFVAASHLNFNGATWDRHYNNTTGTLLASAARTADTPSADQVNYNARGLVLFLSITALTGTGIRPIIQFKDPVTGNYAPSASGSIAGSVTYQTGVAMYTYLYYLGASNTQGYTQVVNTSIPRTWRAVVQTQDGLSATYSLGFAYIL